ncbi:hypothetical protein, partial [Mycobacteroides immunogenum]|uniref:hypothetical protein n=1 Tax=Mycobacteroides immunogenum TaxID=83262 RepID=UPI001969CDE6
MPEDDRVTSPQPPTALISRRIFVGATLAAGAIAATWNWTGVKQKNIAPRTSEKEQAILARTPQAIRDVSKGLITPVRSPILHTPDEY